MTLGEVEEFLWSLSTCLEGEIGDWRLRFGGAWVSVRVNPDAGEVVISAITDAGDSVVSPAEPATTASLSQLTISTLQAAFQQVVDRAGQRPQSGPHEP